MNNFRIIIEGIKECVNEKKRRNYSAFKRNFMFHNASTYSKISF